MVTNLNKWNPEEEPFRVHTFQHRNAHGCYGWIHGKGATFSTFEDALDFVDELMAEQNRWRYSIVLNQAINGDKWKTKGFWAKISSWRRKVVVRQRKGRKVRMWSKWVEVK